MKLCECTGETKPLVYFNYKKQKKQFVEKIPDVLTNEAQQMEEELVVRGRAYKNINTFLKQLLLECAMILVRMPIKLACDLRPHLCLTVQEDSTSRTVLIVNLDYIENVTSRKFSPAALDVWPAHTYTHCQFIDSLKTVFPNGVRPLLT